MQLFSREDADISASHLALAGADSIARGKKPRKENKNEGGGGGLTFTLHKKKVSAKVTASLGKTRAILLFLL